MFSITITCQNQIKKRRMLIVLFFFSYKNEVNWIKFEVDISLTFNKIQFQNLVIIFNLSINEISFIYKYTATAQVYYL